MSKRNNFSRALLTATACIAVTCAAPAFAQETATPPDTPPATTEAPTASTATRVFTPDYFARYAPKTAYDMLRQVPGFTIREADQERGLGQASENVLINGLRISTKSGGATAESQRISASNVERIELVDAATLGIAGLTGLVANIVVKKAAAGSALSCAIAGIATHKAMDAVAESSARLERIRVNIEFAPPDSA